MPTLSNFRNFPFTAQLWNYTRRVDPTGGEIRSYSYARDIRVNVSQSMFGRVVVSFQNDAYDVMDEAQLRELTDKQGNEVYPEGVWSLSGLVPIITPFGTREGYRADAKLTYLDG